MKKVLVVGLLLFTGLAQGKEIVLFDAATSPATDVNAIAGASVSIQDGVLRVSSSGGTKPSGVLFEGPWSLSSCNRVTLELVQLDKRAGLPLTIQLSNPDAVPAELKGVWSRTSKVWTSVVEVPLMPRMPHGWEIQRKLSGMRAGPLLPLGVVADLDPASVARLELTVQHSSPQTWGVKRIVAHTGIPPELPEWMNLPPDQFFPFIDVYGQFKYRDWPGKIHSDADLIAARDRETADLAANPGPTNWSRFGGWAAGPKQKATGHFRVEKIEGKWWMVDPEGYLFWSHGPVRVTPSTAITPLDNREFYFTDLPAEDSPFAKFYTTRDELLYPYYVARNIKKTYDFSAANCYRKYGENWFEAFAERAHVRLRSWGLNTIANSSDKRITRMGRTPYTDRFELKSKALAGAKAGWWPFRDPFDPSFRVEVKRQMLEHKQEMDDPWCFGFFVDNELNWGGPTDLAAWTLASPADQQAKIEFVDRLKKKYTSIKNLNQTWGTAYPNWKEMLTATERPGLGADPDLAEFSIALADAYFGNIRDEFKAIAPNKLYLGARFMGTRAPDYVIRSCAKYADVVSFNIYTKSLANFQLPEGVDKPILIGEFHFGALDRGVFHAGSVPVANQEERGRAYVRYVTDLLKHPQFIGAHWHQFGDQATTGRFDGENFQVGFVDCCDTPYPETIQAIREVGFRMYEIRSGGE